MSTFAIAWPTPEKRLGEAKRSVGLLRLRNVAA